MIVLYLFVFSYYRWFDFFQKPLVYEFRNVASFFQRHRIRGCTNFHVNRGNFNFIKIGAHLLTPWPLLQSACKICVTWAPSNMHITCRHRTCWLLRHWSHDVTGASWGASLAALLHGSMRSRPGHVTVWWRMQLENAEHKTHFSEGLGSSVFEKVNIPRKYVKNPTKWDLSKINLNFDPNLDRSSSHQKNEVCVPYTCCSHANYKGSC